MHMGCSDIEVGCVNVNTGSGCRSGGGGRVLSHAVKGGSLFIHSVTRMGGGRMEVLTKGAGVVNSEMTRCLGWFGVGTVNALADAVAFQRVLFGDARALELVHVRHVGAAADATQEEHRWVGAVGHIVAELPALLALFN